MEATGLGFRVIKLMMEEDMEATIRSWKRKRKLLEGHGEGNGGCRA